MGQSPAGEACNENGEGLPLLNGPTEFGSRHPRPVQYTTDPRKFAEPNDLLFCVRGSTTGRMNWADQKYAIGRGLAAIRGKNGYPNSFVRAVLETKLEELLQSATGSTFPNVGKDMLGELKIPNITPTAAALASSVIDPIDDRITLLRETNKTLEAIAQAIFKSWFIDFDPVRAKMEGRAPAGMDEQTAALFPDELVESELGLVPKGWGHCSLRDVVDIFDSKRIPLSGAERSTRKGSFPYYGAASLMDHVDDYLFDGVHLLIGEDGTVTDSHGYPVTQYVWGKFWVNNHAHILKGKNGISTEHVMLSLKRTNIQSLVTGAVQAKLSQSNMWKITFLNPTGKIAEIFGQILDPLYKRYRHNVEMERTLEGLRDTLLPRLISGRLRAQVDLNAEVV